MFLPEPIYAPPDPKKKLHAKKQPKGHIPRPRNAFILFRCDFVRQKKIPTEVEKDHRNISRIVGQIWRQMDDKQKEPWVLMAEREKMAHSKLYPGYKFPNGVSNKKSKRGDDIPHETQKPDSVDQHLWDNSDFVDVFRSSSSPPGTLHVPHANLEFCNGYGAPLEARDDMARLPSQATFYQSASHQLTFTFNTESFTDISSQHHFAEFTQEDYSKAVANQEYYTEAEEPEGFDQYIAEGSLESKFCGPRMSTHHPYLTPPGPNDPPEWDISPTQQPHTWTDWKAFQFDQSASNGIFETGCNLPGPNVALQHIPKYYSNNASTDDAIWDSGHHADFRHAF